MVSSSIAMMPQRENTGVSEAPTRGDLIRLVRVLPEGRNSGCPPEHGGHPSTDSLLC